METINGLYKAECIRTTVLHEGPYKTIGDVECATADWVDWYNNRRLHSSLGMTPPVEHWQAHYAALTESRNPYENGTKPGALHDVGSNLGLQRRRQHRPPPASMGTEQAGTIVSMDIPS